MVYAVYRKHPLCQVYSNRRNIHVGLLVSSGWSILPLWHIDAVGAGVPRRLPVREGGVHTISSEPSVRKCPKTPQ